jgi:hypothetical protein
MPHPFPQSVRGKQPLYTSLPTERIQSSSDLLEHTSAHPDVHRRLASDGRPLRTACHMQPNHRPVQRCWRTGQQHARPMPPRTLQSRWQHQPSRLVWGLLQPCRWRTYKAHLRSLHTFGGAISYQKWDVNVTSKVHVCACACGCASACVLVCERARACV